MKKIKRVGIRILEFLRKIYWFIFRPKTRGAKCIVENDGKILLVRLAYAHKGWTIPGGGVDKGETFEEAARRELFEETGIFVKDLSKIYEYSSNVNYKRDTVHVFYTKIKKNQKVDVKIDNFEIQDYLWFNSEQDLPEPHAKRLPELIKILRTKRALDNSN